MRKCMYVAFKTGHSLSEIRGSAVAGSLSHQGVIQARDTTWLFDEAAGNLGFNLPFNIPDGIYKLEIKIINPAGKILDTFVNEYDRGDLKPYFNREIQFWDFTTPYAHLEYPWLMSGTCISKSLPDPFGSISGQIGGIWLGIRRIAIESKYRKSH